MGNIRPLRLLFCGNLGSEFNACWQHSEVMRNFNFDLSVFDFTHYMQFGLITRLQKFANGTAWEFPRSAIIGFNTEFIHRIKAICPDIVWVEKALLLLPETLSEARSILPNAIFVCCQEDNPFGQRRTEVPDWKHFIDAMPLYDLHFTKRKSDFAPYKLHGAKRIAIISHGYFAPFQHPYALSEIPNHLKHDTVFVGYPYDHRVASISHLLDRYRLVIDVYGSKWNRHWVYWRHRQRFHGSVIGHIYAQAISGTKICLGYVSSSNLDEYTVRSVEIPACGSFFLAERTPTHQEMYEEGKEAEFFDSDAECANKIRFYLHHDEQRQKIARAGYERCIRSDYSLERYTREAVQKILQLRG